MTARDIVMGAAGAASTDKTYIEDVFSTYLYTGNGSTQTINNGIDLNTSLEATFTTAGTYSWTCPKGVTSVSVLVVGAGGTGANATSISTTYYGGGGGGGGGLAYLNNYPVTPGQSYTVVVSSTGDSYFQSTSVVGASKGGNGSLNSGGAGGTGLGTNAVKLNGGSGGSGTTSTGGYSTKGGGGGGAAGYSGNGSGGNTSLNGSGGGGAGGGQGNTNNGGGGGGGVGLFGQTANGSAATTFSAGGGGGSGGTSGQSVSGQYYGGSGGTYGGGGGGGGAFTSGLGGTGGSAAVRIVWPGTTRQFPSTDISTVQTDSSKGGLVWLKGRDSATNNDLFDTTRTSVLISNSSAAAGAGYVPTYFDFNSNGFFVGQGSDYNTGNVNYASWTFRNAPKFFDVVTYTGNGGLQTINHSLGQVPGMIITKATSTTSNWVTYHRSTGATKYLNLNETSAAATWAYWNNTEPTATQFTVNYPAGSGNQVNASGVTYVAYLFAHDTTTDGLIQCGSFNSADSSGGAVVNLGWEPQYVLIKGTNLSDNWFIYDTMRGLPVSSSGQVLFANTSAAEVTQRQVSLTSTGFNARSGWADGYNFIYMAIRRGPMRTPTDGTKVFSPIKTTASSGTAISTNLPVDMQILKLTAGDSSIFTDRLRGLNSTTTSSASQPFLTSNTTNAESSSTSLSYEYTNTSFKINGYGGLATAYWNFRRAPGFFDVVCYTGTGSASESIKHNLGVAPNLIFIKMRNATESYDWVVYNSSLGSSKKLYLNTTNAELPDFGTFGGLTPTATTFGVGNNATNASARTFVAYLFASCPGVSKVGSYTGNGSSQTIDCGFTNGARFVLIKRTDSTGDWYVWDTARGIVAGNDPHLSLNSTAAEVTSDDTIDPDSTGFIVNQLAATNVNVSGGSYIYLAIA